MPISPGIEKFKVTSVEPTAYYISEFVTKEEEQTILTNIYSAPKPKWTQLSNRRLQNWGGIPHNKGMIAEKLPQWLQEYLEKIHSLDVMGGKKPNHVLVNEYTPGQGILPHLDGSLFYPTITTISVGSHIVLKFLEPSTDEASLKPAFSFLLEPRSLLVLQDKLFHHYLHSIEEIETDVIDDTIRNLNMCSSDYVRAASQARYKGILDNKACTKNYSFQNQYWYREIAPLNILQRRKINPFLILD